MIRFINKMLIRAMVTVTVFIGILAATGVDPSQMIGQIVQGTDIVQNIKSGGPFQGLLNQIDQVTR